MNESIDLSIDLNIDNYDLTDLLSLFKLDYNFNTDDLKQAKKIVIMTHPDKSNLDKKYFLFFTKAFKVIHSIHQFRTRSDKQRSTDYNPEHEGEEESDKEKEKLIRAISKKPNFNKAFNEFFDNNYIRTHDVKGGYGEWLKSDEDTNNIGISNMTQMNETFEKKKNEMRDIVIKKDIKEISSGEERYYDLAGSAPDNYSSSIFSSLPYEDLKKAHVESVVPVSRRDFDEKKKFANANDLKRYRDGDNTQPISLSQATEYLENKKITETKNDTIRAYELVKQDEEAKNTRLKWMTQFNQLTI
jgi:hypothetical protein